MPYTVVLSDAAGTFISEDFADFGDALVFYRKAKSKHKQKIAELYNADNAEHGCDGLLDWERDQLCSTSDSISNIESMALCALSHKMGSLPMFDSITMLAVIDHLRGAPSK